MSIQEIIKGMKGNGCGWLITPCMGGPAVVVSLSSNTNLRLITMWYVVNIICSCVIVCIKTDEMKERVVDPHSAIKFEEETMIWC
jgi:hypothetical protein